MSRTIRFAPAASMVLDPGPLGPRDDAVDVALLDLAGATPELVQRVLRTVALQLGPKIFVQGALRLIITSGELSPRAAAQHLAQTLDQDSLSALPIAVVHGEDLTDRIEELTHAGHELRDLETGVRLVDEPAPPTTCWTPAPAQPIVDAIQAGARIVVCQRADYGTHGIAAARAEFGWEQDRLGPLAQTAYATRLLRRYPGRVGVVTCSNQGIVDVITTGNAEITAEETELPDVFYNSGTPRGAPQVELPDLVSNPPQPSALVYGRLPIGHECSGAIRSVDQDRVPPEFIARLREVAQDHGCQTTLTQPDSPSDTIVFRVTSDRGNTLAETVLHIELSCIEFDVLPTHTLSESIYPVERMVQSRVDRSALEFAHELRPLSDWIG